MKDKVKNISLIVLLILSIYLYHQNQTLNYCSNVWMRMYWDEVEENMILQDNLNNIKSIGA